MPYRGNPNSNARRTGHNRHSTLAYDRGADYASQWQGGGNVSALHAYQAYHPNAAIYLVTYRGRTVWMTSKQQAIWREVQVYWRRGKRDTLARIARVVGCSRATVSRFLRRLDLWRFIDLASLRGRNGGTYVFTRKWEAFKRWTESARMRLRRLLAERVKRWQREELREQQASREVGSTGATLG